MKTTMDKKVRSSLNQEFYKQTLKEYYSQLSSNSTNNPNLNLVETEMIKAIDTLQKKSSMDFKKEIGSNEERALTDFLKKELLKVILENSKNSREYFQYLDRYESNCLFGHPDNYVSLKYAAEHTTSKLGRELTIEESTIINTEKMQFILNMPEPLINDKKMVWFTPIFDGYFYKFESTDPKKQSRIYEFTELSTPDESFSVLSEEDIETRKFLDRINYYNTTMDSMIMRIPRVNLNPDYQRWEVWDLADKQKLIHSIMAWRDIGKFTFLQYSYEDSLKTDKFDYEVIDGKQRISTIRDFISDRFQYNWKYFSQFSRAEKYKFTGMGIMVAEMNGRFSWDKTSRKDVLQAFILLNDAGKPVDPQIIENAKKLLEAEINLNKTTTP